MTRREGRVGPEITHSARSSTFNFVFISRDSGLQCRVLRDCESLRVRDTGDILKQWDERYAGEPVRMNTLD